MGIVVGHDINPGLLPYEAAYLSQQQLGRGNLQNQAAAENARLQPQGGGAGLMVRHNASQAEQGAGFDWQTPIVVTHPDQSTDPNSGMRYDTLYQSQGADPLANAAGVAGASPGFGKLGSREQYIVDENSRINANDPQDRATVGRLGNAMPYGTNTIDSQDADQLFNPQRKLSRSDQVAADARARAGEQPYGVSKQGDALDRQYEQDMAKHRGKQDAAATDSAKANDIYDAETSANTDEAGNGVGADQRVDNTRIPLNDEGERSRREIISKMAELSMSDHGDVADKATGMKELAEKLTQIEKSPYFAKEQQHVTDANGYEQMIDAKGIPRYTQAAVAKMKADHQAEVVAQRLHEKQLREDERQAAKEKDIQARKDAALQRKQDRYEAAQKVYEERRYNHQQNVHEKLVEEIKKDVDAANKDKPASQKVPMPSDDEIVKQVRARMELYDKLNQPPEPPQENNPAGGHVLNNVPVPAGQEQNVANLYREAKAQGMSLAEAHDYVAEQIGVA